MNPPKIQGKPLKETPAKPSAWRTLAEREVYRRGRVLAVREATRRHPDGRSQDFVLLDSPPWVNVLALTPGDQVVLIRQWRHGSGALSLEIPGGLVDPGETPAAAAARELREETGYAAREFLSLGRVNPNPALFGNACHTFLARDAWLDGAPALDENEEIAVLLVPRSELPELVRRGAIDHCVVVAALAFLWLARGW